MAVEGAGGGYLRHQGQRGEGSSSCLVSRRREVGASCGVTPVLGEGGERDRLSVYAGGPPGGAEGRQEVGGGGL